ncbi:hypothetical protein GGR28_003177 [Lewinella aquimaris]|uniref:SMODS and SLOG-associating 2TM effector domain-containing protein n=1 Tax=Neolewinella aquimaris TaxID=1835722 RepID=A0A840E9C5_9BACT|nr:SLATT domain-containing protein [Neolewinella aquimaris]MBB4080543.1 hypothetical protein [Neolewinella aquimaris]
MSIDIKPTDFSDTNGEHTSAPISHLEDLEWTSEERNKSLTILYRYGELHALQSINWYLEYKNSKSWWSRALRIGTIFFGTLGGLFPVLSPLLTSSANFAQLGYIAIALSAGCIAVDRFFGFSSGWMRYMTTANMLTKLLQDYRLEWAMLKAKLVGKPPTDEQLLLYIQRIKEFIASVNVQVEQETSAWVTEFQTSLVDIEKSIKKTEETTKPGAIDITVTNGMEVDGGFTLFLDGMTIATVRGTKYQIGYVTPGPHKVAIVGRIGANELDASELVNVDPGIIAKVTLALPVMEAQP